VDALVCSPVFGGGLRPHVAGVDAYATALTRK